MAVFSTLKIACVSLAVAGAVSGQSLVPKQDINLPASSSAAEPLQWLGANSPWFAGICSWPWEMFVGWPF